MKKVLAALVVMCLLTTSAIAGIARTDQTWSFSTSTGPVNMAPDNPDGNPYGNGAIASITSLTDDNVAFNQGGYWEGQRFRIVVDVQNRPLDEGYKIVHVDMVFRGSLLNSPKWVVDGDWNQFSRLQNESWVVPLEEQPGWFQAREVWRIEPNPSSESMCFAFEGIDGGLAALDSITVTTWCIPEPATLGLLAVGAVGLLRKRK